MTRPATNTAPKTHGHGFILGKPERAALANVSLTSWTRQHNQRPDSDGQTNEAASDDGQNGRGDRPGVTPELQHLKGAEQNQQRRNHFEKHEAGVSHAEKRTDVKSAQHRFQPVDAWPERNNMAVRAESNFHRPTTMRPTAGATIMPVPATGDFSGADRRRWRAGAGRRSGSTRWRA